MIFKDSTVLSAFLIPFFVLLNGISLSSFQKQLTSGNIQKWINSINTFVYSKIFNIAKGYRSPIVLMVIIGLIYVVVIILLANALSQSVAIQRFSLQMPKVDIYKKLEKKKKYNRVLPNFLFDFPNYLKKGLL